MRRLVVAAIAGAVLADALVAWWLRRRRLEARWRATRDLVTEAEIQRWLQAGAPRPDPADWHTADGGHVVPIHVELRMRA